MEENENILLSKENSSLYLVNEISDQNIENIKKTGKETSFLKKLWIQDVFMNEQQLKSLISAINFNDSIEEISFYEINFKKYNGNEFKELFSNCQKLKFLTFSEIHLNLEILKNISLGIQQNRSLKELHLENNQLSAGSGHYFYKMMKMNESIEKLVIIDQKFPIKEFEQTIKGISQNLKKSLKNLTLDTINIGDKGCQVLAQNLGETCITQIYLRNLKIGNQGIGNLFQLLKSKNCKIEMLSIDDKGYDMFNEDVVDGLTHNNSLKFLTISIRNACDITPIFYGLKENKNLKKLLFDTLFQEEKYIYFDKDVIFNSFSQNKSLTSLLFEDLTLNERFTEALFESLKNNKYIKKLTIETQSNYIFPPLEFCKNIKKLLGENTGLKKLKWRLSFINQEILDFVIDGILSNYSLKSLNLIIKSFSHKDNEKIYDLIQNSSTLTSLYLNYGNIKIKKAQNALLNNFHSFFININHWTSVDFVNDFNQRYQDSLKPEKHFKFKYSRFNIEFHFI